MYCGPFDLVLRNDDSVELCTRLCRSSLQPVLATALPLLGPETRRHDVAERILQAARRSLPPRAAAITEDPTRLVCRSRLRGAKRRIGGTSSLMRESRFDAQDRPLSVEDVATGTVAAVVDRALCHRIRCSPGPHVRLHGRGCVARPRADPGVGGVPRCDRRDLRGAVAAISPAQ